MTRGSIVWARRSSGLVEAAEVRLVTRQGNAVLTRPGARMTPAFEAVPVAELREAELGDLAIPDGSGSWATVLLGRRP